MVKLPNSLKEKLSLYKALLLKWSKAVNLVSPTTLKEADTRHLEDSLQLVPLIPDHTKILFDLGSGAGFPGLVLAMALPNIEVHLVESDQKKCAFLSTVSRETLTPVIIHNERIENVDRIDGAKPDVITARALASLVELIAMTELWWTDNPQLVLVFPKGAKATEEIEDARKKYAFDVSLTQSRTDDKAQILTLKNLQKL